MKKLLSWLTLSATLVLVGAGCAPASTPAENTKPTETVQTDTTATSETSTPAPTEKPVVQPVKTPAPATKPVTTGPKTYTMAEVAAANSAANCLTVINGSVYNLTDWIDKHPGGDRNILRICGIDGSSAYNRQHGGQSRPEAILADYKVGVLK